MKLRTTLLSITLSLASLVLTPSLVFALNPQEISQKAESVTVRISHPNSPNQGGSGVIIERNGNEYTVLTNCHVIEVSVPNNFVEKRIAPEQFRLFPGESNRSQGYEFEVVSNCEFFIPTPDSAQGYWKTDLAVLRFTSNENLPVAALSENLVRAESVYVAGYPLTYNTNVATQRSLRFTQGNITQIYPSQGARRGYEVVHDADTRNGMSGGPIFNGNGELIAISGKAEESAIRRGLDFHGIPLRVYQEWRRGSEFTTDKITVYLEEGKRLAAANNYAGAVKAYSQAIALNPNDATSYFSRGYAYSELGEYEKAIRDYNEALRINPVDAPAYNNRGYTYSELGEYEKAIRDYNEALRIDPNFAFAYDNRGLVYYKLGEYEKAIHDYNEALRINPNLVTTYNSRGTLYSDLGEYEKAIHDYNEALHIDPEYTAAYHNRGNAYFKLGETQKAISDYNEALHINPNLVTTYNSRGTLYSDLGEYEKAIRDYNEALRIDPEDADAYYNRGNAYRDLGEYQRAIHDYNEALHINLNFASAHYARGASHFMLDNRRQAIADFRRASELYRQQGNRDWYQRALDNIRRLQ